MNYIKQLLLFSSLMIMFSSLYGQIKFQEGYVITNENDTLIGLIGISGEIINSKVCKFKTNKNSSIIKYTPNEIKSYRIKNGNYYKSIEVSNQNNFYTAFVEVLIDSKIKLYHNWKNNENSYYIEKNDTIKSLYNYNLTANDIYKYSSNYYKNSYYNMSLDLYKDTLAWVFNDSKELYNKISNLEYDTESLIEITKEYLNVINSKQNNSSYYSNEEYYEKDISEIKPSFGIYSGLLFSQIKYEKSEMNSAIRTNIPIGISYQIPLPLYSKQLSLQIELIYKELSYRTFSHDSKEPFDIGINTRQLGLPVFLVYNKRLKNITPSIGIGKEFNFAVNSNATFITNDNTTHTPKELNIDQSLIHSTTKNGWLLNLGIEYHLKPKLSVFGCIRYQSFQNLLITDSNLNNLNFNVAKKVNDRYSAFGDTYQTNMMSFLIGIKY